MKAKKPAIDAIIHIGAGRGKDFKEYLATDARHIVLIDADPKAIAPLRRLGASVTQTDRKIDVIEAAVAGEEKEAQLHIYNLERLSGICAPDSVIDIYPGLKLMRTEKVRTRPAAEVVADQKVDPDEENLLVLEAPGEELSILENLAKEDRLAAFSRIKINASRDAPCEGAATAEDIASFLEGEGYLITVDDHGDWAGLSALMWRSGRHRLEMERIKKELNRVETARAAHEKKVIELSKQNANLAAEVEKEKAKVVALDRVDRKALFETELRRCESQLDHLKELFANGEE